MKCVGMKVTERDWLHVAKSEDYIDSTEATYKVGGVLLQDKPTYHETKYGDIQEYNIGYL